MNPCILMFGGASDERFVSVASAQNLANNFSFARLWFLSSDGRLFDVSPGELAAHTDPFKSPFVPSQRWFAESLEAAVPEMNKYTVFLGLHGTEGEDGKIQALLEKSGVAFTGSGSVASRICFDKPAAKKVLAKHGILTAPELILSGDDPNGVEDLLTKFFQAHQKIVVKPIANGSSIGLHIIPNLEALAAAIEEVRASRGESFMAEKFVSGREVTVGVVEKDGRVFALPPSEVLLVAGHSFDYDGKYLGKGTQEITPADLTESDRGRVQKMAVDAHQLLGCFGYSRTDIILGTGNATYLETNTLPGMTKASFVPQQLSVAGISLKDFLSNQIEQAERRRSS